METLTIKKSITNNKFKSPINLNLIDIDSEQIHNKQFMGKKLLQSYIEQSINLNDIKATLNQKIKKDILLIILMNILIVFFIFYV